MKKLLAILLSMAMILSMSACGSKEKQNESAAETAATAAETTVETTVDTAAETAAATESETLTQIANPWSDLDSLADAEKIAGVTYSFQETICNGLYKAYSYRAMKDMIEISYKSTESDEEDALITIRQAPKTSEDISGIDYEFSHDFTDSDAGVSEIRIRGSKDYIAVCSFDYGDYSYVIYPPEFSDGNEVFTVIGEMTGVAPTVYVDEPEEGAPLVEEGRFIDEEPIDALDMAGVYNGINYGDMEVNVYTSSEDNRVGTLTLKNKDGDEVLYEGEFTEYMTNYYGMEKEDVTFTVYSDNGNYGLDLYIDGEHADYLIMTEHFES